MDVDVDTKQPVDIETTLSGLFQPDALDTQQFNDTFRNRELGPERNLMLAVLMDALDQLKKPPMNDRQGQLRDEALEWIQAQGDNALFSFESVCGYLDLDADYLRKGLLKWTR